MRRVILAAAAVVTLMAMDSSVHAAGRRVYRPLRTWQINRNSNPVGGIFQRLMDLERAKNDWLFNR